MDGNGCSIGTHILSYKPLRPYSYATSSICVQSQGISDAERTTEDALRREPLVNWDELLAVKPAG